MKVSIIVAAYNIENYIKRCMDSIVSQTFKDIEIIVVNDGSTDNTSKIIESFANNDKRIKTIDKQNEGLIEARKSGLKIACGEYILFLDGDDWLHTQAIEKLYKKAIQDDSDIVLYNFYLAYDSNKLKAQKSFEETVKYEDDYLKVHGYIGKEIIARGSRNNESIFVNNRYIKNKTIVAAVENAFKSFSTVNKFPFFVLFIELNPEDIDVNIHPTKAEIKFKDERVI